ncbi:PleD family two-component system response regulator [Chamaesiphon sp. VAR_48_metabat_135_sub]|uniref:GGDEF domain-containing response regulator n=1 Tax=Chamaesiphon sp. VAR_48_metabat_135_sub TaxID=2964699 RepID=UPI00286C2CB8|nr:PleD family two-component system response regulator [Chamaesiphon sp. VAR_48_metabat_135_sub]
MNTTESSFQRILLVDDDLVVRAKVSESLEQDGFKVILAKNGNDGITAYQEHHPDLILVDAVMPILDGFEFCEQLKNLGERLTPILMITSLDDNDSVDRAFASGATDYITKPINLSILRQRVRNLIRQSQLIKSQLNRLQQANQSLQLLANLDSLTKLSNRRGFDDYIQKEWTRMSKIKAPLSLIMCDVDFFKNYNDRYLHPNGDKCLIKVAMSMQNTVRRTGDLVARYGGEEFAIILPNTDALGAVSVAENVRSAIKSLQIVHEASAVCPYVTVSVGVSTIIPNHENDFQALIHAADRALYQAKSQGRDRVSMIVA